MNCNTCAIGITLLISSVFMTFLKQNQDIFIDFFKLLDESQKQRYREIVKERVTAYTLGIVTGLFTATLYTFQYPKQSYPLCTFLAIVYLTKLSVYYLYPKSPLMLYSLTTKQQTDAWAQIYETMKARYKISLLVGFLGYLMLFSSIRS